MKIRTSAKFNEKEIQLFSELYDELNDIRTEISNRAMNLEEELIKESLIKLGWSPPSSELCDKTLSFLYRDFGKLKWMGSTEEWDRTIEAVRTSIYKLMSNEQKIKEKEFYEDI